MTDQKPDSLTLLLEFLKSPVRDLPALSSSKDKTSTFFQLLFIELFIAIILGGIIAGLGKVLNLMEDNLTQKFFEDSPVWVVFILGVVVGPVVEELFFRLHLRLNEKYIQINIILMITGIVYILVSVIDVKVIQFSLVAAEIILLSVYFARKELLNRFIINVWDRKFFYVFYFSAGAFGLLHITNYSPKLIIYLLMPILVLPQFIVGLFCGYVRLKLGFRWSCLFHAAHNFAFIVPFLFSTLFTNLNNKPVNTITTDSVTVSDTNIR